MERLARLLAERPAAHDELGEEAFITFRTRALI
jgi:hypothetical protein